MKIKQFILSVALVMGACLAVNAQVKVGDNPTTISPSAILEMESTNKAMLVPRVANTAAIASPVNGMIIYDVSSNCFKGYQNGAWTDCGFAGALPPNAVLTQIGNEGDSPNTVPSVVTAAQLASVPGVTGVVPANQAAYQAYIDANPNLFASPATVAEVNAMITTVNAAVTPPNAVLAQVGNEGDSPNTVPSVVTAAQLASVPGVTGVVPANQAAYQAYIDANPNLFASPATQAEVQAMINAVNTAQAPINASNAALVQVGNEGDSPNTVPSVVTVAQINTILPAITGALVANQAAYQAYIDANPNLFASPATQAEVQAMINAVNAAQAPINASNAVLAQIGNEGDSPNTVLSVVTVAQINTILPAITGAIVANQAAYQAYIDANPNLFASPATQAEVQAMINAVNAATPTAITSSTGKIWMDRNLGATRVALSATDHLAYGDLYQWGRNADGHEKITWTNSTTGTPVNGTTATRPNADQAATPLFITINTGNFDWRGTTQNNNLWQGVAGINNPCPAGFRVPTSAEINAEVTAYGITNSATAFSSPFKFTVPGGRTGSTGDLVNVGSLGFYWSSSVSGTNATNRGFDSGGTVVYNNGRANGLTVRCLKD